MKLNVLEEFKFYHDGVTPTVYPVGKQEVPEDAASVAIAQKWAEDPEADDGGGISLVEDQKVLVAIKEGEPPVEVTVVEYGGGKTFKCRNASGEIKQYRTAQIVPAQE